jgi:hypothetical protein
MGLRPRRSGLATPEFDGKVVSVEGDLLVIETDAGIASRTITSVRDACDFLGIPYRVDWYVGFRDPLEPGDPDAPLEIDAGAVDQIGEWLTFGSEVLEAIGGMADDGDEVTEAQLWPEHLDLAIEMGSDDRKASYGFSPGDGPHPEPYLYVSAWGEIDRSNSYWNDPHFNGASLGYRSLLGDEDPAGTAIEFLMRGYRILH